MNTWHDITSDGARIATARCTRALAPLFLESPIGGRANKALAIWKSELEALRDEWPYITEDEASQTFGEIAEGLAEETSATSLRDEYMRLFVGPQHLEAPPWGSVYTDPDGVLFGASTLELRNWLRANAISFAPGPSQAEDHIGILLELAAYLADKHPELQRKFFEQHLLPWAHRYLELLADAARHPFYQGLAHLADATFAGIGETFTLHPRTMRLYR